MGVVFSASLLVADKAGSQGGSRPHQTFLYLVSIILFGFAIPAASWLSFMAWFGELVRMERVGRYLRGLEVVLGNTVLKALQDDDAYQYLVAPLRWETYIAQEGRHRLGASKQRIGYLGCLGLYTGLFVLPLIAFLAQVWINPVVWSSLPVKSAFTAYALLALASFIVSVVRLVMSLQRVGREAADLAVIRQGAS